MSDQALPISPKPSPTIDFSSSESNSSKSDLEEGAKDKLNKSRNKPIIKQTARKATSRIILNHLNYPLDKSLHGDENCNYLQNNLNQKVGRTKQTARKRCTPYPFPVLKRKSQPIVVTGTLLSNFIYLILFIFFQIIEIDEDYFAYQIESSPEMKQTATNKNSK